MEPTHILLSIGHTATFNSWYYILYLDGDEVCRNINFTSYKSALDAAIRVLLTTKGDVEYVLQNFDGVD